ncbi:hypothetical protein N9A94_08490 [Akkermansiaceae bacterium]|nr:hypothetical protein [Akkermansiaceae bacterium]
MKKFIVLLTAGTAFAFASCSTSGGSCCGKCKTSCASKTECADCKAAGGSCAKCEAKKAQ